MERLLLGIQMSVWRREQHSLHPRDNRSNDQGRAQLHRADQRTYRRQALSLCGQFHQNRADVYDNTLHRVELGDNQRGNSSDDTGFDNDHERNNQAFVDERLPRDFVPFNVQALGNDIVVTYVLHQEGSMFETDGPGLGYVDTYSSSGKLLRRLEHGSWLNVPWGVALAPLDFGRFSHDLLVAQFAGGGDTESSGLIAAYDIATGKV